MHKESTASTLAPLYGHKAPFYFSTPRLELIELINRTGLRVLDIGCGAGDTGRRLLETKKAEWVTGIELVRERGEIARSILQEVHIGNVEEMRFDWKVGDFDCFIFGDVLEHLTNPWSLLKRLRPFLAEHGIAVASIPNVKHWPVLSNLLLHDDWQYVESGVLDITHLRFFTRRTAVQMFTETGYSVELIQPYFNGRRYSIPNRFTFGMLAGVLSVGWLIRSKAA